MVEMLRECSDSTQHILGVIRRMIDVCRSATSAEYMVKKLIQEYMAQLNRPTDAGLSRI